MRQTEDTNDFFEENDAQEELRTEQAIKVWKQVKLIKQLISNNYKLLSEKNRAYSDERMDLELKQIKLRSRITKEKNKLWDMV